MRSAAFDSWVAEARAVPVEAVARARAPALRRSGSELVGACPAGCSTQDGFAVSLRKGVFTCRKGGAGGDAIALVQHLDGCDFLAACEVLTGRPPPGRDAAETAEERAARERALAARAARRREEEARRDQAEHDFREAERKACWALWRRAERALAGTPVEAYLRLRALKLPPPGAHLRYAPDHPLFGTPRQDERGRRDYPVIHRGPAMLAAILGPDNRFAGVHATWIDPRIMSGDMPADSDGKARIVDPATGEIAPARKARGSTKGGRIELVRWPWCGANGQQPERWSPDGANGASPERAGPLRLFLGEGRETVLAAWCELAEQAPEVAAESAFWSAIDLGNLGGRAAASVPHPTLTATDRRGATRPVRVPGPEPDPAWPAIPIPDSVRHLYLLGDGDSEPFATRCALVRAALRYARLADAANGAGPARGGRDCHVIMAPDGADWNDVRRGRFRVAADGEGAA